MTETVDVHRVETLDCLDSDGEGPQPGGLATHHPCQTDDLGRLVTEDNVATVEVTWPGYNVVTRHNVFTHLGKSLSRGGIPLP